MTETCRPQMMASSQDDGTTNWFHKVKNRIGCFISDLRNARGPARIDILGRMGLFIPALASASIIILILTFLWIEAVPIFAAPEGGIDILFDLRWNPNSGLYGIGIFIVGSFLCTFLAIGLAVPLGVGAAIFLSEFCPTRLRTPLRMIIEMMAAIPSIVYGLWAYVVIVPFIKNSLAPAVQANPLTAWMPWFQGKTNGLSLLAGGLILAVMLLPTVITVSDDALRSVPRSYREASFALGATKSETARKIVMSAAIPGIGAAIVLSLGRAVGETMAVLMVTGNSLQIPLTLFQPTYVMTSIITNQLGYAFVFPLWRSALFAVGLVLLIMSIAFTLIAKFFIRWGMKTRGLV
ncbi:phosphate ABC transporter permease subunit PstC [Candidatus Thorarchaeota archaeon]|nr:MAG: phosphate ABC transporter permease subunit PstC [Candidatus Thorarchaeota archaeon]